MFTPERLGPYILLEEIGIGGMAVVYRAEHETTGEIVAVKTPRTDKGDVARLFAGLRTEIQVLSRLRHPGIVRILDEGRNDPRPWYAMELLRGRTFQRYIRDLWSAAPPPLDEPRPLASTSETEVVAGDAGGEETMVDDSPPRKISPPGGRPRGGTPPAAGGKLQDVLRIALLVCEALAYLHPHGIIHRDISPRNLFLRHDGSVVLVDLGLASRAAYAHSREKVDPTHGRGTPPYVSPEHIVRGHVDPRSDLYSFACVLYEMIAGRPPFVSSDPAEIRTGHLQRIPRSIRELVSGVPREIDHLLRQLLEKEPRHRTGHASDVASVLRAVLGLPPPSAPEPRELLFRPRIAGRNALLLKIYQLIEGTASRRGYCGIVRGESGSGKTRVVNAVAQYAVDRGFRVVKVECVGPASSDARSLPSAGPLHPLRPLLTAIYDYCQEHGAEATSRILGKRGRILAAYEPSFLHLPGQAEGPEPASLPPYAAEQRLVDALRETVCAFADEKPPPHKKPLLLVLDDLQWADELTLAFLMRLTDGVFRRHAIALLGTYRCDEKCGVVPLIAARPWIHVEHLGPLDKGAVGEMASDMLGVPAIPEPHAEVLAERSLCSPFFVVECLRMLVAEGTLARRKERWELCLGDRSLEAILPRDVEELIRRRLRALGPVSREILEIASVLGREVDVRILTEIRGEPISAIRGSRDLVGAGLLDEAPDDRLRFVHDKIREVAYRDLPEERRAALHAAAATALLGDAVRRGEPVPHAAIAHHRHGAGDLAGARDALAKAGCDALGAFAAEDAIKCLQEALALDDRLGRTIAPRRRAAWLRNIAQAYVDTGQSTEGKRWVEEGLTLLGSPVPETTLGLLHGIAYQSARFVSRLVRGPDESASEEQRKDWVEAASAAELLVPIFTYTKGNRLELFHAAVSHLHIAEKIGAPRERAWAYINAHVISGLLPFAPFAGSFRDRALEALAEVPDPRVRSWIHLLSSVGATGAGDWDRAVWHGGESAREAESIGWRRRWEEAQGMLCTAHLLHGDFERAIATSHRRFDDAARRGDVQTQLWAACGLAQAELNMNRTGWILDHAEWMERRLRDHTGRNERIFGHAVLAEAWLRAGDLGRARDHARAGAAAVDEGWPPVVYCVNAYSMITGVLLALAASDDLRDERLSLEWAAFHMCREVLFSAVIYPVHRARCLLYWGRLVELSGAPGAAARLYEASLSVARKYDQPFDEALAQAAIARSMGRGEPGRDDRLRAARDLFAKTRAAHEVARIDANLAA